MVHHRITHMTQMKHMTETTHMTQINHMTNMTHIIDMIHMTQRTNPYSAQYIVTGVLAFKVFLDIEA